MTGILLALALAAAPAVDPEPVGTLCAPWPRCREAPWFKRPPASVQVTGDHLDRVAAAVRRLECFEGAAAELDQAELERARAAPGGAAHRAAGARWLAARRALSACRRR